MIYTTSATITNIPICFHVEIKKKTLKFIWKHETSQVAKAMLRKRNDAGGFAHA